MRKSNYFLFIFILILMTSCETTEEIRARNNVIDPKAINYTGPKIISTSLDNGTTITAEPINISWTASEGADKYAIKFGDGDWSKWLSEREYTIPYLDEGEITISIKAQDEAQSKEGEPKSVTVTIDLFQQPTFALRLRPIGKDAFSVGETIRIDWVMDEFSEADSLLAAQIFLTYNSDNCSYINWLPGAESGLLIMPEKTISDSCTATFAVLEPDAIHDKFILLGTFEFEAESAATTQIGFDLEKSKISKVDGTVIDESAIQFVTTTAIIQ